MKRRIYAAAFAAGALASTTVFASGLERSSTNSAKYSALGDAVSGYVAGPQALFYNPSGLSATRGMQVAANLNPIWSNTTAPIGTGGAALDGQQQFSVPYSAFVSYALSDDLSIGAGTFIGGGFRAAFDPAQVSTALNGATTNQLSVTDTEYSVGVGYRLMENLRIGAAYRLAKLSLTRFDNVLPAALGGNLISIQDATQWRGDGFRVGAQYQTKTWGVGADYRNPLSPTLSGNAVVTSLDGSTQLASVPSTVTGASLPSQINVSGYYNFTDALTGLIGYTWTKYSDDSVVNISQTFSGALAALNTINYNLNWNDMHNIRVGAQLAINDAWTARAGYIWTNQVTPTYRAIATATPPAAASAFALGAGWKMMRDLSIDIAGELTASSGDVGAADIAQAAATGSTTPTPNPGTYKGYRTTLRLGVEYRL